MTLCARVFVGVLFGSLSLGGCGRSDLLQETQGADSAGPQVDYRRELILADERVVLVELVAPASDDRREALRALSDGVALEGLITAIFPEEGRTVELDVTGELSELRVFQGEGLRGIIWL